MARIFSRDQINLFQGIDRSQANVTQIANWSCHNIEYAAHAKECTLLC